jgi:hypothetical protein
MDDERPVAWTAMPPGAPVFGAEGDSIGTTQEVLGDEGAGIFHGVVVKRKTDGQLVEVSADDVSQITTERVRSTLTAEEAGRLPPYDGESSGLKGLLDKVSDKLEPGS